MASLNPFRPSRAKQCRCKCKSHCLVFNASTELYEGDGKMVSRSTRDNHAKDDKLLATLEQGASRNRTRHDGPSRAPTVQTDTQLDRQRNWIRLCEEEILLLSEFPVSDPMHPLEFANNPSDHGEYIPPTPTELVQPNRGTFALSGSRANTSFLTAEYRLCELATTLSTMERSDEAEALGVRLHEELSFLSQQKAVHWAQQRIHIQPGRIVVNTEIHFYKHGPRSLVARAASVVSLVMENLFFTPRRALRAQLAGSQSILRVSGLSRSVINEFPKDPRPISSQFRLDPFTRQFLSCPNCYALFPHKPGDTPDATNHSTITHCSYCQTPGSSPCNTPLWKQRKISGNRLKSVPCRKYLHQDLKFWLGRMLSRKGIEDIIAQCQHIHRTDGNDPIPDIWYSKVFATLRDADGNEFFPGPAGQGRLVFSLSVDSFNPFHMKIAKQSASSTGIWLVLLNLPPHLRYLPENIFLAGVIPGPGKPSLDQINHSLQLVVNDLLEFWNPGVFFTRTYNHERGMLYNAMLVPLVADMTAARQVLGLPGSLTAHSFCSFCDLDLRDIDIFDKSEWPAKNVEDIRRMGQLWKEAPTEKAQDIISTSFGRKWSALLDLPYWNPVDYAVVESMHALDIGLFQHHCRDLFKIDVKRTGGDASLADPPTPIDKRATNKVQKKSLSQCLALIKANSQPSLLDNLLAFERKILYIVCVDNDIIRPGNTIVVGTRWLLANDIYRWRHSDDPSLQAFLNPLPDQPEGTTDPDDQSEEGDSDEQSEEMEDNNSEETTDDQSEAEGDEHSETGEEEQVEEIGDDHLETQEGTEETHTGPTKRSLPEKDELDEKFYKAVAKVISLLVAGEDEKARRRGTKKIFAYILEDVLQMDLSEVEYGSRPKQALFDFFLAKIADDSQILEELKFYIPGEPPVRAVLGKDIMEAVWDDMKRTQLPTWIRPGPPNWGTAARGKLSADQWRVNCVIHLVITLIRLWGHDTGCRKELLDHYMELVNAVVIANIRIMSPELIKKYKEHIVRYAEGCLRLYPEESIRPNLHVALHLDEVFDFFGPNHAISAPFYERYINFFHRMNTNKKLGELESTFMTSSARTSALRAILADDEELRELVHEVIDVLEATEREDARGYRLASLLDPTSPAFTLDSHATQMDLDDDTHRNLSTLITTTSPHQAISLPKQAMSVNEISISGVSYGTSSSTKYRNSNIIFRSPLHQPVNRRRAGSVRSIFQYTHHPVGLDDQKTTEFFVVVKEYLPMDTSDGRVDPYKQYGFVAGYLCDPDPQESYVIRLVDVVSHFVLTDMVGYYDNLIHVLPVDRLMLWFRDDVTEDELEDEDDV